MTNRLANWLVRTLYRGLYPPARVWWWLRRPHSRGAHVAVWCEGQLLVIEQSYRSQFWLPGGCIQAGESSRNAAIRELAEEVGIVLPAEALSYVGQVEMRFESRLCSETVFEVRLETPPSVKVDCREIISARFVTPSEARRLPLSPIVSWYLERVAATIRQDRQGSTEHRQADRQAVTG